MRRYRQLFRALVGLAVALAILAGAGCAPRTEGAATPEAFVSRFVQAIDSKDSAEIEALVYGPSLACLTGEGAALLADTLARWIADPIPPHYTSQITEIAPQATLVVDAFMPGRFVYPVRPTRNVQIEFAATAQHSSMLLTEIGLEDGAWKVVLPCPKAGTMAWLKQAREEKKARDAEQAQAVEALLAALSPTERDRLQAMADAGQWIDAVHKLEKDRQVELTIAVLAMKKLAPLGAR